MEVVSARQALACRTPYSWTCVRLSLNSRRAVLQTLEETLEQAAVCFLIGLDFSGEVLRDMIVPSSLGLSFFVSFSFCGITQCP
ncbi:MAG TPA: hypothetical protein VNM37_12350, partial [Candidatus Dormibacteraeota bacterium]|nr:hypothetical protein [Candidatus Dormibacteraeota bacterium]